MSVLLVAEREIRQQVGSKAFKLVTAGMVAAIAAAITLPTLFADDEAPRRVGVVGSVSTAQREAILAAATLADAEVEVEPVPDLGTAEVALRSGDLDLAVVEGPALLVEKPLDAASGLSRLAGAVSQVLGLQAELQRAGLSPEKANEALQAPLLPLRSLEPPDPDGEEGRELAFAGAFLLYLLLTIYGAWIVTAVVQEKSSRVVEVLLSAVRPADLLVGKVLGIGAVALGQAVIFALVALVASVAVGLSRMPDGTPLAIASALVWLLLGFALYSFAYAIAGSLASRQEDAQNASLPLTGVLLLAYFAGTAATTDPDTLPVRLLSVFPPTAPIVMPARLGAGDVAPWETAVAVVLILLSTYGMARLAAHIYPRVALHSGARLKLRAALRSQIT